MIYVISIQFKSGEFVLKKIPSLPGLKCIASTSRYNIEFQFATRFSGIKILVIFTK